MVMAAWPFLGKGRINSWWIQRRERGCLLPILSPLFLAIGTHQLPGTEHSIEVQSSWDCSAWEWGKLEGSLKASKELETPIEMETPDPKSSLSSQMCVTTPTKIAQIPEWNGGLSPIQNPIEKNGKKGIIASTFERVLKSVSCLEIRMKPKKFFPF